MSTTASLCRQSREGAAGCDHYRWCDRRRLPIPKSEGRGSGLPARTVVASLCRCTRGGTGLLRASPSHQPSVGQECVTASAFTLSMGEGRACVSPPSLLPLDNGRRGRGEGWRRPQTLTSLQPTIEVTALGVASSWEQSHTVPGMSTGRRHTTLGLKPWHVG